MELGQVIRNPLPYALSDEGQQASPGQDQASPNPVSSDFETFLKMLTVQMKNQDPLNPSSSSDFAVQLATFSGVEQQVRSNQILEGLAQQMGLMGMAQMAGWIGMEARAAAPAYFDGTPITVLPSPASAAQETVLVVTDAQGREVERITIPVSSDPVTWAGVDSSGNPLPAGLYSFELESYAHGELLRSDLAEVYARITEARNEGGQTVLILHGGVQVPAMAVNAVRSPV